MATSHATRAVQRASLNLQLDEPTQEMMRHEHDIMLYEAPHPKDPWGGEIENKIREVPHWYGLGQAVTPGHEMTHKVSNIVQELTLHKWLLAGIVDFVESKPDIDETDETEEQATSDESPLTVSEFTRMMNLAWLSIKLSMDSKLSLDALLMTIENERNEVGKKLADGLDWNYECERLGRDTTMGSKGGNSEGSSRGSEDPQEESSESEEAMMHTASRVKVPQGKHSQVDDSDSDSDNDDELANRHAALKELKRLHVDLQTELNVIAELHLAMQTKKLEAITYSIGNGMLAFWDLKKRGDYSLLEQVIETAILQRNRLVFRQTHLQPSHAADSYAPTCFELRGSGDPEMDGVYSYRKVYNKEPAYKRVGPATGRTRKDSEHRPDALRFWYVKDDADGSASAWMVQRKSQKGTTDGLLRLCVAEECRHIRPWQNTISFEKHDAACAEGGASDAAQWIPCPTAAILQSEAVMQAHAIQMLTEGREHVTWRTMLGRTPFILYTLYLIGWCNIWVAAIWIARSVDGLMDDLSSDDMDVALMVYTAVQGSYILFEMCKAYWRSSLKFPFSLFEYFISSKSPDMRISHCGSFIFIVISSAGCVMLSWDLWEANCARFLVCWSCLLVLTRSKIFAKIVTTLSFSLNATLPYLCTMIIIMFTYAILAQDLFEETALEDDGSKLFPNFVMSCFTMWRLFIGEGWHGIMYSATDNTSSASKFFFMSYTFIATMLFGQLLVGVIISMYNDVDGIRYDRVYRIIEPLWRMCNQDEKEQLLEDLLEINWRLFGLQRQLHSVTHGIVTHDRWLHHHQPPPPKPRRDVLEHTQSASLLRHRLQEQLGQQAQELVEAMGCAVRATLEAHLAILPSPTTANANRKLLLEVERMLDIERRKNEQELEQLISDSVNAARHSPGKKKKTAWESLWLNSANMPARCLSLLEVTEAPIIAWLRSHFPAVSPQRLLQVHDEPAVLESKALVFSTAEGIRRRYKALLADEKVNFYLGLSMEPLVETQMLQQGLELAFRFADQKVSPSDIVRQFGTIPDDAEVPCQAEVTLEGIQSRMLAALKEAIPQAGPNPLESYASAPQKLARNPTELVGSSPENKEEPRENDSTRSVSEETRDDSTDTASDFIFTDPQGKTLI